MWNTAVTTSRNSSCVGCGGPRRVGWTARGPPYGVYPQWPGREEHGHGCARCLSRGMDSGQLCSRSVTRRRRREWSKSALKPPWHGESVADAHPRGRVRGDQNRSLDCNMKNVDGATLPFDGAGHVEGILYFRGRHVLKVESPAARFPKAAAAFQNTQTLCVPARYSVLTCLLRAGTPREHTRHLPILPALTVVLVDS